MASHLGDSLRWLESDLRGSRWFHSKAKGHKAATQPKQTVSWKTLTLTWNWEKKEQLCK